MDAVTISLVKEKPVVKQVSKEVPLPGKAVCIVPATTYVCYLKRVVDIVVSASLILLVLTWLTPILFILIRLTSKGPLFFIQQRGGYMGRCFTCIKYRTMSADGQRESNKEFAADNQITTIGRFLRITHIDELPQLFNVLIGNMSLVGPRPHMIYHDGLFSSLLPNYKMRHLVKPGITGLAQAAGYHGTTSDFFSISHRTRLDLFYVNHLSFQLDLKIIFATLFIVPMKFMIRWKRKICANGNSSR